jgi:hypothetical protein
MKTLPNGKGRRGPVPKKTNFGQSGKLSTSDGYGCPFPWGNLRVACEQSAKRLSGFEIVANLFLGSYFIVFLEGSWARSPGEQLGSI